MSIENLLQNLNQTSLSWLNLNLKSWPNLASESLPRFNFVTSTKHQQQNNQNTNQNLAWLQLKILTKLKVGIKFSFMTKPQLPNLQQTVANMILMSNISNSNNLNKFWVVIYTPGLNQSGLLNRSESVSESVSETSIPNDRTRGRWKNTHFFCWC